ncbi:MAG: hypothetical protein U0166_07385 [Acidobacteriota bacterium]
MTPRIEVSTRAARAVLPAQIPLDAAVARSADLAAFVSACHSGDLALLARTIGDSVVNPARLPLIPGAEEAVARARDGSAGREHQRLRSLDLRPLPVSSRRERGRRGDGEGLRRGGLLLVDRHVRRRLPRSAHAVIPAHLSCIDCAGAIPSPPAYRCDCGDARRDLADLDELWAAGGSRSTRGSLSGLARSAGPIVWRFRELVLPLDPEHIVTRGEGNTGLYRSDAVARHAGLASFPLKHEART